VVYETDSPEGLYQEAMPSDLLDSFESLIKKGDRVGAVTTFLRHGLQLTSKEIETAKTRPTFPATVSAAHTFPREVRAAQAYRSEVQRCEQMNVPTLLLVGGDSPDHFKTAMARWQSALPNARTVVLPGQAHMAYYTAPDLFVPELKSFLVD
jgi:pimeloyl-ACP methyl ester carboxylesterase